MDLGSIRGELSRSRKRHSTSVANASKFVKGVLILGGAFVAGLAQFWTWPSGAAPDVSQIVGMAATFAVGLGGIFVLATERDAADALAVADKAVDSAQILEARFDEITAYIDDSEKLAETYQLCLTMRGAIEQSAIGATGGTDGLVSTIFDLASRPLTIAIGFEQSDRWTLGVYKAQPSGTPGKVELKSIAQKRAIECTLEQARVWPEGVGIAGICYTNGREIVLPDLRVEGMRAVFGPRNLTREYDVERYVSMVAVPIKVAGRDKPWGVVVATSDRAGHFAAESRPGFKTDEPVRALSAFIALAVAMTDARDRAQSSSAPTVTVG
jgi:hypothetical protein